MDGVFVAEDITAAAKQVPSARMRALAHEELQSNSSIIRKLHGWSFRIPGSLPKLRGQFVKK